MTAPRPADGLRDAAVGTRIALRRPTGPLRRLPDFLLVGTQRGGTTSLYNYLDQHPDVVAPLIKEPQFFAYRHRLGLGWYRALFPLRPRRVGMTFDATPYYLFHPLAAERAAALVPAARVVVLLRDPVERAFSHYKHSVRLGLEDRGFDEALDLEPDRLAGEDERIRRDPAYPAEAHRRYSYLARGRYADQLRRWFAAYPREQVLVLRSEDLFADPAARYAEVLAFLGLAPYAPPRFDVFTKSAPSAGARDLDPATRRRLERAFAAPNADLEELLGRPMGWGAGG